MEKTPHSRNIVSRQRFLRSLVLLIVLLLASSLSVAVLFGWQMQRGISSNLLKRGANAGKERRQEFFHQGERLLRIVHKRGSSEGLNQLDQTVLDNKFLPVLEENRCWG